MAKPMKSTNRKPSFKLEEIALPFCLSSIRRMPADTPILDISIYITGFKAGLSGDKIDRDEIRGTSQSEDPLTQERAIGFFQQGYLRAFKIKSAYEGNTTPLTKEQIFTSDRYTN